MLKATARWFFFYFIFTSLSFTHDNGPFLENAVCFSFVCFVDVIVLQFLIKGEFNKTGDVC